MRNNRLNEALSELYLAHNKRCDICGTSTLEFNQGLCIDHCHTTGKVRGFLCHPCNLGVGFFSDSKVLLQNAITYLDNAGSLTRSLG